MQGDVARGLEIQVTSDGTRNIPLFCHFPKKRPQTLILSLAIAGCNDGNSNEFPRVTEEGYSASRCYEVHC